MKKRIGLIFGGKSTEHDVSLKSAFSISGAIDYNLFSLVPIYIQIDGTWKNGRELFNKVSTIDDFLENSSEFLLEKPFEFFKNHVDVVFPIVHGTNGEDGTLQGFLEMMNVPYVGCGVISSAIGIDKVITKQLLKETRIPQCEFLFFSKKDIENDISFICNETETYLGFPCFVKPAKLGSSVGIKKAKNREELISALEHASLFDDKIMIEELIVGRELEVSILGNDEYRTSVVGEIYTTSDFYDYEAKYENQNATELHIPANIPAHVENQIRHFAKLIFKRLDGSGLSRIDFFWNENSDELYFNEINTVPGFTPFSMYPMMFEKAGLLYSELITTLIDLAEKRYDDKKKLQISIEKKIENQGLSN